MSKLTTIFFAFILSAALFGCTTTKVSTDDSYTNSLLIDKYDTYTCKDLLKEAEESIYEIERLETIHGTKSSRDIVNRIIGFIIFPPLALLPGGGAGSFGDTNEPRLSAAESELTYILSAAKHKNCDTQSLVDNSSTAYEHPLLPDSVFD